MMKYSSSKQGGLSIFDGPGMGSYGCSLVLEDTAFARSVLCQLLENAYEAGLEDKQKEMRKVLGL